MSRPLPFDVVVVGSANADLIVTVHRIPRPGETLMASADATRSPGGKGLNQAVAAGRAGARTGFVGAVAADDAGDLLRATLRESTVDVSRLRRVEAPTGLALITVDADGENCIVVVPGANATLDALTADDESAVSGARVLLGQLEAPVHAFAAAARIVRDTGGLSVLNAAPAAELPADVWAVVDLLIVNEHEAADLAASGADLLDLVPAVLTTLGARGSRYVARGRPELRVPATPARAVDTTGAGDTYCGVLVAAIAGGLPMQQAMRRAGAAAALAVETAGAVPSIPVREAIERRLAAAAAGQAS